MNERASALRRLALRRLKLLAGLVAALIVAAGAVYLLAPGWIITGYDAWLARRAGLQHESVQVGGTRWAWYAGGEGRDLMLLHGFTGSKENWLKTARFLTPNFHVVIPDLPGWGESSRQPGADYGAPAQARRLAAFVDKLDLRRFALIGHSMGGLIAGLYAAGHPLRLSAVGFIDSAGVGHPGAALARALKTGNDPFAYDDRSEFEHMLAATFAKPPHLPGRIEDVYIERNRGARDFLERTFAALTQPAQARGLEPVLPALGMPALVLWCHGDRIVDPAAVEVFRSKLTAAPRIDVSTLFGCGHMPMLEQPRATAQIIGRFLSPSIPMRSRPAIAHSVR